MRSRLASSFSLDVFVQTPTRSTVSHDTSTQLPLTEFFIGCIFSNDPFDRQCPSSVQDDIGSVSLPPLLDIATTCALSSSSLDSDDLVRTLAPRALLQPPPGLEQYAPPPGLAIDAHLRTPHDPGYVQLSQSRPHSTLLVPSMWEHIMHDQLLLAREVLVLLWREPTILPIQILVQGLALFLNREPSFFLWSTLVNPNLKGTVVLIQLTVISCIINFVFPSFNGIQAQRAQILPTVSPLPVEGSMRLFFRKPVIMFRTSPISSLCAPAIRTLLSCYSTSKGTWRMVLLIVRGLLRRPSLSGSPTVTFCSVHIHNFVAKKRDASTELLQRLYGYMREHNVDFIGGDFNMSAFSTFGDVCTDAKFSGPGNSFLWRLGALEEPNRECAGFLIMPKRPYEWRVHSHGFFKSDNATLGFGPRDQSAHLPVFLHLRTTNLPGPSSVMRSEQAQQRRFERRHNKERMQRRRS